MSNREDVGVSNVSLPDSELGLQVYTLVHMSRVHFLASFVHWVTMQITYTYTGHYFWSFQVSSLFNTLSI